MVLLPPKMMVLLPPPADGAIAIPEVVAATQAKSIDVELPPVPPNKVSKTGTDNGRKKSLVWNHFEKVKIEEGVTKAICNYCKKSYHANNKSCGTSNLLAHVTNCPKNPNREEVKGRKTLAFESKNDGDEGFQLVSTTFIVETPRKALVEMIIIGKLPFRCVEGYGFKKYVISQECIDPFGKCGSTNKSPNKLHAISVVAQTNHQLS